MTLVWLLFWFFHDMPAVKFSPELNSWAVFLLIAIFLDVADSKLL